MLLLITREEKFVFIEKSLVTRHFNWGVSEPEDTSSVQEIIFNFVTGSALTPMSVFNARIVNNGPCCISPRISDQSSANDNTQRLATTETTEPHGSFNLFHFQNDQMWPVNMTGKTKGWPVNIQISSDIVRWPAVISSPGIWNRILAEMTPHIHVARPSMDKLLSEDLGLPREQMKFHGAKV